MNLLLRSRNFVQRWAYLYRDGGIETMNPMLQTGRPAKLACESPGDFKQRIVAEPTTVDNGLCTLRGKDAMRILRQEFGIKYSLSSVYALMHRLGLPVLNRVLATGTMIPLLCSNGSKSPPFVHAIQQENQDKKIEVWFQDEARIGQQGTLTSVWVRRVRVRLLLSKPNMNGFIYSERSIL